MVSKSGCVGWMKKRTHLEKTLLSLSSLLLLTLLLMIVFGTAYHGKKSDTPSEEASSCWSDECIETAGDILSPMDLGVDSCSNFYGFACGKYGREPKQSISASRESTNSVYFALKNLMESREHSNIAGMDIIRNFYNSCVSFGSYRREAEFTRQALVDLMADTGVGMWPIIDPLYETASFSLEKTLASLTLLDVPVAFQMEVVPDDSIAGAYFVKIQPGGPHRSGLSQSEIMSDVHRKSSVLTSLLLLGTSSDSTNTYLNDILSVDGSFAAIDQDNPKCHDVSRLAPEESLSELKRLMPEIDWKIVLSEIQKATDLARPFAVELHCKQKIRDYIVHLKDLTDRSIMDYLGWRFFAKFMEHVIPSSLKFRSTENGDLTVVPRWRVCLELMEKFFSPLLVEAFTRKMVSKEVQSEVQKMSESILGATKQLVSRARWLTEQQKSKIREKVTRIQIRYPFQAGTDSTDVLPPQVHVSNFTDVVVQLHKTWVVQKFKKLNLEEDSSELMEIGIPLTSISPSSTPNGLSIPVYVDTIQSPYFRPHVSRWMNYGGFGVFLAREISKVLMSLNADFSSHESSAVWNLWMARKNSSSCMLKAVTASLGISEEDLTEEERQYLAKQIVLDRSSSEIAYQSASSASSSSRSKSLPGLQDLSQEKMFFLSYAQTLCSVTVSSSSSSVNIPAKERFNSAVSSSKIFNEVFSCASSSPECHIWA